MNINHTPLYVKKFIYYLLIFLSPQLFAIDASGIVGNSSGAFSVNQGNAMYSLPITTPKGVAGMKPELSLVYNSASGNGIVGMGFSIDGLSTIHRCSKTLATDGITGSVNYDANDAFCLDGERLVTISGTNGVAGSEYRTEIESFRKVAFDGNSWLVKTKSGQTFEYGNTFDSKIEAQGSSEVRLWAVNKITDIVGNAITYHYNEDNTLGEYNISHIDYDSNTIAFHYAPRGEYGYDDRKFFEAGSLVSRTKLLSSITTQRNNTNIRTYTLNYRHTADSGLERGQAKHEFRSLLTSVQECIENTCLPKTTFDWQVGSLRFLEYSNYDHDLPHPIVKNDGKDNGIRFIDINGNGFSDVVYSNGTDRKVYLNTGSSWQETTAYQVNEPIVDSEGRDKGVRFLDINGDGKIDYLRGDTDDGIKKVYLNTGSSWQESTSFILPHFVVDDYDYSYTYQVSDCGWYRWKYSCRFSTRTGSDTAHNLPSGILFVELNGDGRVDIVYGRDNVRKVYLNTGTNWVENTSYTLPFDIMAVSSKVNLPFVRSPIEVIDLNADGLADILSAKEGRRTAYINTGNSWIEQPSYAPPTVIADDDKYNSSTLYKDFNGDSLTDISYLDGDDTRVFINTGNGWMNKDDYDPDAFKTAFLSKDNINNMGVRLLDVNNDGLVDAMWNADPLDGSYVSVNRWDNFWESFNMSYSGGFLVPKIQTSDGKDNGTRFADLNGDGFLDAIHAKGSSSKVQYNTYKPPLITRITDGFNSTTNISYSAITDGSVYSKAQSYTYPDIEAISAHNVVSSVVTDNAIGGQNTVDYSYQGAKYNLQGRGFLGFEAILSKNRTTEIENITLYKQEFPYIGKAYANVKQLDGTIIAKQLKTYKTKYTHNSVAYPYVERDENYTYKLDGTLVKISQSWNTTLDAYGNTTRNDHRIFDKNIAIKSWIQTHNVYTNDPAQWILGRLKKVDVYHQRPNYNGLWYVKSSAFNYNATGLLTSETLGRLSGKPLTTNHEYDSFGNKIKTTVSASGIDSRNTTYEYSSDGRDLVTTTNALGHSETKAYDDLGRVTSLTGPNGLTTCWEYDALDRKIKETRADGSITTNEYTWAVAEIPFSVYKITTTSSGSAPTITYFDAFNREIRKQTLGFDGSIVNIDTQYDALGRILKKSMPYFDGDEVFFATSAYDALGRIIATTTPDDSYGVRKTTTIYDGLSTTVIDPLGNSKTTIKNAMDEIIEVQEEEGAYLKRYHDVFGNLIKTDANGILTTISYDARGNKISMNDPSMGVWNYNYNALDELISQTDALGQTVTMQYDKLGRMTMREEAEGITTWVYDTENKGIGKLARVTSPNLLKTYTYDELGRPFETTTHLSGKEYTVANTYDAYSRLHTQTLPGNFKTENVYNENGFISAIRVPKEQIGDYDFEHLRNLLTANLEKLEEVLTKAAELEEKAKKYQQYAGLYRYYVGYYAREAKLAEQTAQQLTEGAKKLDRIASQLQSQAAWYSNISKLFLVSVERLMYLSTLNVPDNEARSYVDTKYDTTDVKGFDAYYNTGHIPHSAKAFANGYTECSSKDACISWAESAEYIGNLLVRDTQQKLQIAQKHLKDSSALKLQALEYNRLKEEHTERSASYANIVSSFITLADTAMRQAIHWKQVASANSIITKDDNRTHYNEMINDDTHIYLYKVKSIDSAGRVTGFIHGNGLSTENTYNPATGNLLTIKSGFSYDNEIRDYAYGYDANNNVISRINNKNALKEHFVYDSLDRLLTMHNSADGSVEYRYDTKGNLLANEHTNNSYNGYKVMSNTTKSSGPGINPVTSYHYDSNGNMTRSGDKIIEYTSHNKPKAFKLADGSQTTQFLYDGNRNRYQKIQNTYDGTTHTQIRTTYIGKSYEKIIEGDTITHKYFIYNSEGQLIAIHAKEESGNPFDTGNNLAEETTNYLHYDNLGSIDTITDGNGNVVEHSYYAPFGNKDTKTKFTTPLTNRGYTGHEHINEFGFIHMNGRVYDPTIGRFLSPDPHIQFEYNSQSYNRYTYVMNNPLKYTDPSGYFIQFALPFIGAALTKAAIAYVGTTLLITKVVIAYAVNYALTYAVTGNAQAARSAGLAAGINMGIGEFRVDAQASTGGQTAYKPGWGDGQWRTVVAHGLSSSAIHAYNGGDAGIGFISGAVGSYFGPTGKAETTSQLVENTITNAVIGGATTALGGGKFKNGAQSSAFRYLFNESMEHAHKYITTSSEEFNKDEWEQTGGNYLNKNKVITVDATKIAVELSSTAFPPTYQQRVSITAYPLDESGNTYPMMAKPGYFHAGEQKYMTGSNVSRIIIYQGGSSNSRWWVSEPRQVHEHQNVSHSWFNVYVPK